MFQRQRGTRDFSPEEMQKRRFIENKIRETFELFNYKEIQMPTFEELKLFTAKSGEGIIKQLYNFKDKSGNDLALRPEMTAQSIRFYVSEMQKIPKPIKIFYFGNCFRYEEPQSARYREFWQFGAECIGSEKSESDAEIIALAYFSLKNIGLKNFKLRVGNVGILKSMIKNNEVFTLIDKKDFENLEKKCNELKIDFENLKNIVGCKDLEKAKELLRENEFAMSIIEKLQEIIYYLDLFKVEYEIDLGIARGLDYYTGMVFEIDSLLLVAEKQICGGGNYSLIELFGGEKTSSTGFALGFDRIMIALEKEKFVFPEKKLNSYVFPISEELREESFKIATLLRENGISVDVDLMKRNSAKNMKYADSIKAENVVILGEDEFKRNSVVVKNMKSGKQEEVKIEKLVAWLKKS